LSVMIYSEKRCFQRIPSIIYVFFYCSNTYYSGIVENISMKGMLIRTNNICFPFDMQFEVYMPLQDTLLHIPVNLSRMMRSPDSFNRLGVEIQNPSRDFVKLVKSLDPLDKSNNIFPQLFINRLFSKVKRLIKGGDV